MVTQKQNKTIHGLMRGVSWPERHTCPTLASDNARIHCLLPILLHGHSLGTMCLQEKCLYVVGGISGWHTLVNLDLFAWIFA